MNDKEFMKEYYTRLSEIFRSDTVVEEAKNNGNPTPESTKSRWISEIAERRLDEINNETRHKSSKI